MESFMNERTYSELINTIARAIPNVRFWKNDIGITFHVILDKENMELIARDLKVGHEPIEITEPWQPFIESIGDGVVATTDKVTYNEITKNWEADLTVVSHEDYYMIVFNENNRPIGFYDLRWVDTIRIPLKDLSDKGIIGDPTDAKYRIKKNREVV